ncbi:hypothetical protein ACFWBV_30590 [Streptomyces sp. NPDC060030]|uniref:hypothetical protein n=1 Tax=Streptomyces sp. NPDC060030 TaxID=3347042 RepID=UPI00367B179E
MPYHAGTGFLVLALAVAGAVMVRGGTAEKEVDRAGVGHNCRSTLPRELELSCGTYGFGDLRQVCPADGPCERTTAVTGRNFGSATVYVTVIAGPAPGDGRQGGEQRIASGRSAVLRPPEGQWLFDITLRGAGPDPKRLTVTGIR